MPSRQAAFALHGPQTVVTRSTTLKRDVVAMAACPVWGSCRSPCRGRRWSNRKSRAPSTRSSSVSHPSRLLRIAGEASPSAIAGRVDISGESVDAELRQTRLSKFGRVLAGVTLGYCGLNAAVSVWLRRASFNINSVPLLAAGAAFAAMWLLLRGSPRPSRFVRAVELVTLAIGTTALASMALVLDLTSSPDMIARSTLTYVLLVYAVYVPSTARHTLIVALLMTVPLLGSIFLAFSKWDPALYDPPAAVWRKQNKGDMAYMATFVSAFLWSVVVGIAVGFSHTIYGLRRAISAVRKLGQYTLEEKIGEGGMGVVYRASHGMLRRPTAIKLLARDRAGEAALERFEREVRRTAALTHPNTVTVFDYGRTTDGVFYYAMELLDGASLDEIVETYGPQPEARVIYLLDQVAASLAEAHGAGLIHRDIKPANIMIVDRGGISDLVKVLDFGLVKDLGANAGGSAPPDPTLTAADTITGTPLYMAPEAIISPGTVDARTDIYALGAVGYWLLTGTHVFSGTSMVEVCAHHLHSSPEPPSLRLRAPVAEDLERLLLDCLAKRPEDRPGSARILRERLRSCASAPAWTNDTAAAWWAAHSQELATSRPERRADDTDRRPSTVSVTRMT
jgi:eukaryotic-like serine/threonine-protein kinase